MKIEKNKLSTLQRRYYRGVIVKEALKFYEKDPKQMVRDIAEAVDMRFTTDFVHELLKMLFNRGKSTNDLVMTPEDYLMANWSHFNQRGLDIPRPNEGKYAVRG